MEKLEVGYYWVKHNDKIVPARWDGKMWHHGGHQFPAYENNSKIVHAITLSCPTGCRCTTNSDGSITVNCGGQDQ